MTSFSTFEEIEAWKKARELTRFVYQATRTREFSRDTILCQQLRSATISILSNIAEGFDRGSTKEFLHFLSIAKGSNAEVRAQLYVALDSGHLDQVEFENLQALTLEIGRLLGGLMRYLVSTGKKGSTVRIAPGRQSKT